MTHPVFSPLLARRVWARRSDVAALFVRRGRSERLDRAAGDRGRHGTRNFIHGCTGEYIDPTAARLPNRRLQCRASVGLHRIRSCIYAPRDTVGVSRARHRKFNFRASGLCALRPKWCNRCNAPRRYFREICAKGSSERVLENAAPGVSRILWETSWTRKCVSASLGLRVTSWTPTMGIQFLALNREYLFANIRAMMFPLLIVDYYSVLFLTSNC